MGKYHNTDIIKNTTPANSAISKAPRPGVIGKDNFVLPPVANKEKTVFSSPVVSTSNTNKPIINTAIGFYKHDEIKPNLVKTVSKNNNPNLSGKPDENIVDIDVIHKHFGASKKNDIVKGNDKRISVALNNNTIASLDTEDNLGILPKSPVKPEFLTEDQHNFAASVLAYSDCVKDGGSMAQCSVLCDTVRGNPGTIAHGRQHLINKLTNSTATVDYTKVIAPWIRNGIPMPWNRTLGAVPPKGVPMFLYELCILGKFNTQQLIHLSYNNNKQLSKDCYNNSPNPNPDYTIEFDSLIGYFKSMGVDLKFIRGYRPNHDIVKGCTDQLAMHTLKAHNNLLFRLDQLKGTKLTQQDADLAETLYTELEKNIANFNKNKDASTFSMTFNDLHLDYRELFIRHKLGMNFLVELSRNDFLVEQDLRQQYIARHKYHFLTPDSKYLLYMKKAAADAEQAGLPFEFFPTFFKYLHITYGPWN